ncbi:MAG TPA: hypothetical protein VFV66_10040 [Nonomuraea sp.]|nr:hypothetical protein [Nonomuraea sp.]
MLLVRPSADHRLTGVDEMTSAHANARPVPGPTGAVSESATSASAPDPRNTCRALLEQFNAWLQETVPQAPHLAGVVPVALQAVQLYRSEQYDACIARVREAAEILRLVGYSTPMRP